MPASEAADTLPIVTLVAVAATVDIPAAIATTGTDHSAATIATTAPDDSIAATAGTTPDNPAAAITTAAPTLNATSTAAATLSATASRTIAVTATFAATASALFFLGHLHKVEQRRGSSVEGMRKRSRLSGLNHSRRQKRHGAQDWSGQYYFSEHEKVLNLTSSACQ